jgi:hypothetical protein
MKTSAKILALLGISSCEAQSKGSLLLNSNQKLLEDIMVQEASPDSFNMGSNDLL